MNAIHRPEPAALIEPMLGNADVAALLKISVRELQRRVSAGAFPKADNHRRLKEGGPRPRPRWRPETVRRWMEGGGL